MKRNIVISSAFERSYKRFAGKNAALKDSIAKAIQKLQADTYNPSLRTHKLSGNLTAYLACSCGYDCRIIFKIEKDTVDASMENIVLLDIGTHDDVY